MSLIGLALLCICIGVVILAIVVNAALHALGVILVAIGVIVLIILLVESATGRRNRRVP